MSDWLMRVIKAEAKQLLALAADDQELRIHLRALANEILAATEEVEVETDLGQVDAASAATVEQSEPEASRMEEPLRELTLGRSVPVMSKPQAEWTGTSRPAAAHDELEVLEARCRSKAEAARWAVERLLRMREGNDHPDLNAPVNPEMAEWASKITDCLYWVQSAAASEEADLSLLEDAGGCFETLAEALAAVGNTLARNQSGKAIERVLPLVAEAQSALRAALKRLGAVDDPDQLEIFEWVKVTAARQHVYLKRFMRADDAADPSRWSEMLLRIEGFSSSGQLSRQQASELERINAPLERIGAGESAAADWQTVIQVVSDLVESGVPPSNREIRDTLLKVVDALPERSDLPDGFERVLREIDRFLARRRRAADPAATHAPSAEVSEAARLIRGRSIVLIGGTRRREAQESLRRALKLAELIWIETKEHESIDSFEPMIARPEVAVVLLAIRWSSHAFGDVRLFCDRHNKPLVRLPAGYGPNQVAAQILAQCSGRLEGVAEEPFSRQANRLT